jgi:hypothetical protein
MLAWARPICSAYFPTCRRSRRTRWSLVSRACPLFACHAKRDGCLSPARGRSVAYSANLPPANSDTGAKCAFERILALRARQYNIHVAISALRSHCCTVAYFAFNAKSMLALASDRSQRQTDSGSARCVAMDPARACAQSASQCSGGQAHRSVRGSA